MLRSKSVTSFSKNDLSLPTKTIVDTQRLHSFHPISPGVLEVRQFSLSEEKTSVSVAINLSEVPPALDFKDIKGYVVAQWEHKWWLACMLSSSSADTMVTLSFLHPAGRCRSYTYPRLADILELPAADILFIADPKTVTGRSYTLSLEEMDKADSIPL